MHMLADRLGFMIATNILLRISICATCWLIRNILAKLANMSSTRCSRTTSLRINSYFISTKSWLAINLRSIDSYWKKQRYHWRRLSINRCHNLIVYFQFKEDLCKLRTDQADSELFPSQGFLLDRSYTYLFKTAFFVSSFLAYSSCVHSQSEQFASDSLSNG